MTELQKLLDKVYGKCIPDEDCMIWQGAKQSKCKNPAIYIPGKRNSVSLRRLLLSMSCKFKINKKQVATSNCENAQCVRLEHLIIVNRRKIQLKVNEKYNIADKIQKSIKITEKARKHAKLTMELANEIRAIDLPHRTIAKQYNIAQSTVGSIKRNKTWVDRSNPFLRLAA